MARAVITQKTAPVIAQPPIEDLRLFLTALHGLSFGTKPNLSEERHDDLPLSEPATKIRGVVSWLEALAGGSGGSPGSPLALLTNELEEIGGLVKPGFPARIEIRSQWTQARVTIFIPDGDGEAQVFAHSIGEALRLARLMAGDLARQQRHRGTADKHVHGVVA